MGAARVLLTTRMWPTPCSLSVVAISLRESHYNLYITTCPGDPHILVHKSQLCLRPYQGASWAQADMSTFPYHSFIYMYELRDEFMKKYAYKFVLILM